MNQKPRRYAVTLPYPPAWNNCLMPVRMGKVTRLILSKKARDFKADAYAAIMEQGPWQPVSGPVSVEIHLYPPSRRGDADGGVKLLFDACSGHLFDDDKQVCRYTVLRHEPTKEPRAELMVEEAS